MPDPGDQQCIARGVEVAAPHRHDAGRGQGRVADSEQPVRSERGGAGQGRGQEERARDASASQPQRPAREDLAPRADQGPQQEDAERGRQYGAVQAPGLQGEPDARRTVALGHREHLSPEIPAKVPSVVQTSFIAA
jgi:hypothetical protein